VWGPFSPRWFFSLVVAAGFCPNQPSTIERAQARNHFSEGQKVGFEQGDQPRSGKKIAQNVAQTHIMSKFSVALTVEKSGPKVRATYVIKNCPEKTITPWAKNRPIWSPWF
jgi:hypothetical protein